VSVNTITTDFTREELLKLDRTQLGELFKWYGLTYQWNVKKEGQIEELFVQAEKEKALETPRSIRIQRIYDSLKEKENE